MSNDGRGASPISSLLLAVLHHRGDMDTVPSCRFVDNHVARAGVDLFTFISAKNANRESTSANRISVIKRKRLSLSPSADFPFACDPHHCGI